MPNFYLPHKQMKVARYTGRPCSRRVRPAAELPQARRDPAQGPPKSVMKFRHRDEGRLGTPGESITGASKMKAFKGLTISVGLLLAATAANAQGAAPQDTSRPHYSAASDFSGPYGDVPPGPAVPAPAYGPQAYGPQGYGPQVGPGPSEYGPPLMPPTGVYAVLRENGFSPLGAPRLRGLFYSVSAIDRRGDDGRLVIDARDGRIVRFVPADRFGGLGGYGHGYYGGARRPSYGPLEPMTRLDAPRPPGALPPKIASRMPQSVPMPQAAPSRLGETRLGEKRPADAKPLADKLTPAAPMQQSAAVQAKPADVAPSAAPVEGKTPAPAIQATQ